MMLRSISGKIIRCAEEEISCNIYMIYYILWDKIFDSNTKHLIWCGADC